MPEPQRPGFVGRLRNYLVLVNRNVGQDSSTADVGHWLLLKLRFMVRNAHLFAATAACLAMYMVDPRPSYSASVQILDSTRP